MTDVGEISAVPPNSNLKAGGDDCSRTEGKSSRHECHIDVGIISSDGAPAAAAAARENSASPSNLNLKDGGDDTRMTEEKSCHDKCGDGATAAAAAAAGNTLSIITPEPVEPENQIIMVVAKVDLKKAVSRSGSHHEHCRVCQDRSDEPLLDLGCGCRGELAKAHRSCIEIWFKAKGSNKCEICLQIAVNVPTPDSSPGKNYWIWRVDQVYGGSTAGNPQNERRSSCPIWFALSILIGGLLLDVFVSLSLGVSALPVNIIIGALILLGLGTSLRLGFQCHSGWDMRRILRRRALTLDPPAAAA